MTRKINAQIFSRFQDRLLLEQSDGQDAKLVEGVQPVVDITPQIQDSYAYTETKNSAATGVGTITYTCPEGKAVNIKNITAYIAAWTSGGSATFTLSIEGQDFTILSATQTLGDSTGWKYVTCDFWLNPGDTITYVYDYGTTGVHNMRMDLYGLQYGGV